MPTLPVIATPSLAVSGAAGGVLRPGTMPSSTWTCAAESVVQALPLLMQPVTLRRTMPGWGAAANCTLKTGCASEPAGVDSEGRPFAGQLQDQAAAPRTQLASSTVGLPPSSQVNGCCVASAAL